MGRRFHLALFLVLCGAAAWWLSTGPGGGAAGSSANAPEQQQAPVVSQAEVQRQFAVLERQKEASLGQLSSEEIERQKRDAAAAKKFAVREQEQIANQPAWARLLSTNWATYQKIRAQAVSSKEGTAFCTICNGHSKLDSCILCGGTGKCPTCGGTGHLRDGDVCPNCLGSGKCYLCGGTGKMVCPFCDDGLVYASLPPPPNLIPIYCNDTAQFAAGAPKGFEKTDTSRLSPQQVTRMSERENAREIALEPPVDKNTLILIIAVILSGGLALRKLTQFLERRINAWASRPSESALREKLIAEEPTLVAFFSELRYGLATSVDTDTLKSAEEILNEGGQKEEAGRLKEFFDWAPGQMVILRAQLSKVCRTTDKAPRVELLREFFQQLTAVKEKVGLPELRPAWLMTCGLQGLVQQLSMTATHINPSVLRTAAGAVDLLEILCAPGADPNLATRTPVELLAVDDNAVCLSAVSLALKKAFRQPDLAAEGVGGLALAQQKQYDAIFLDVEMPGMDGFELCQKIHETYLNRTTPIIFVTSHSDFNSRAQSTLVGGQDLIAKPFLSFEITVKALTLTLRGRLENKAEETEESPAVVPVAEPA